jgi:hypothetical protein
MFLVSLLRLLVIIAVKELIRLFLELPLLQHVLIATQVLGRRHWVSTPQQGVCIAMKVLGLLSMVPSRLPNVNFVQQELGHHNRQPQAKILASIAFLAHGRM